MNELELYVHIPFCVRKCAYCDFLSGPADDATRARYLAGLFDEFASYREKAAKYRIKSVFVGGGTPTALSEAELAEVLEKLQESFDIPENAELTVECNPGTLSFEKLKTLKKGRVNRLSIGLQSALDSELKLLSRIHSFEEFEKEYGIARELGFDNINIDIMQALPGQSYEAAMQTVDEVLALRPQHISAYSLIIEEGTPFFERFADHPELLPEEETERRIYHETEKRLEAAGYRHYEISNYALEGFECRHNLGYWTGTEYLGLGLGASSLLEGKRFSNLRDIEEYINKDSKVDTATVEHLSQKDLMAEFMILGLRLTEGVSCEEFEQRFGTSVEAVYGQVIKKYCELGLLKTGERIALTKKGLDLSNTVMCEFLPD